MNEEMLVIGGLSAVMVTVLLLPFFSKRVEEDLEIFLFIMGIVSVSISRLCSWHLVREGLVEPIKITIAVLIAGLIFRMLRKRIADLTVSLKNRYGYRMLVFIIVIGLGLLSSVVTAIIAALILSEVLSVMRLPKSYELKIAVISCFAIGLGATLTPLGEPLATIAISKLRGEPYHADFLFLFRSLGVLVIPAILALGIYGASLRNSGETNNTYTEDKPETYGRIILRTLKIYLFVFALVFLGTGFTPIVEGYLVKVPAGVLYWINTVSAVLDNATLTAAEISPEMTMEKIKFLLMGLLIAGGMLIPGNIPNIICASKLSIKSKDWAVFGAPLGAILMVIFFVLLNLGI